jgi:hypothetical protein
MAVPGIDATLDPASSPRLRDFLYGVNTTSNGVVVWTGGPRTTTTSWSWPAPARVGATSSGSKPCATSTITGQLSDAHGTVARIARTLVDHCRLLTEKINDLEAEITALAQRLAPALLDIVGCRALTAAKILGETATVTRFRSAGACGYARTNCNASSTGNRAGSHTT